MKKFHIKRNDSADSEALNLPPQKREFQDYLYELTQSGGVCISNMLKTGVIPWATKLEDDIIARCEEDGLDADFISIAKEISKAYLRAEFPALKKEDIEISTLSLWPQFTVEAALKQRGVIPETINNENYDLLFHSQDEDFYRLLSTVSELYYEKTIEHLKFDEHSMPTDSFIDIVETARIMNAIDDRTSIGVWFNDTLLKTGALLLEDLDDNNDMSTPSPLH